MIAATYYAHLSVCIIHKQLCRSPTNTGVYWSLKPHNHGPGGQPLTAAGVQRLPRALDTDTEQPTFPNHFPQPGRGLPRVYTHELMGCEHLQSVHKRCHHASITQNQQYVPRHSATLGALSLKAHTSGYKYMKQPIQIKSQSWNVFSLNRTFTYPLKNVSNNMQKHWSNIKCNAHFTLMYK